MAVNQPMISDNQVDNSWKLEVTNQINNEEARVNALASRIDTLQSASTTTNDFAISFSMGNLPSPTTSVNSLNFPIPVNCVLTDWAIALNNRVSGTGSLIFDLRVNNAIDTTVGTINYNASTTINVANARRNLARSLSRLNIIGLQARYTNVSNAVVIIPTVTFIFRRT